MTVSPVGPVLRLRNVTKRFGGLTAVNDVSIEVGRGEIVGVVGPNGSGKTTLFSTISGFLEPNEGEIEFGEDSIVGLRPHEICRRGVVRTFQIVQPFAGLSVLDNVVVGCLANGRSLENARSRAAEILDFVGMGERRAHLGSELALQDRKRLELARALSTDPQIILLDEVMAGLRPTEVTTAVELVRRIRDLGVTILIVEHLMQAVYALCERLYVLHHGVVIASGEPREVMEEEAVVDAYFGSTHADA